MRSQSQTVIAYVRVSTEEQAASGLGLADQRATIDAEASRRGWSQVITIADEGHGAKSLDRPGMAQALHMLATGQASTLVVSKLDRLSRSLLDFAGLMERAKREGWELVVLDMALDTTSPSGRLMAQVMACFAEYERELIGQRTRAALAQKKAAGYRLGRPVTMPEATRERIVAQRAAGASLTAIADALNAEGVPTARGGKRWHPATIAAVLKSVSLVA